MNYDENWKAGVNNMARPGDVANLVIERDSLIALMILVRHKARLAHALCTEKDDNAGLLLTEMVAAIDEQVKEGACNRT